MEMFPRILQSFAINYFLEPFVHVEELNYIKGYMEKKREGEEIQNCYYV